MKLEQAAAILGVPLDANLETLKTAYKKLALKWHPDKCPDGQAKERFQDVSVAYTRLVSGEEDTSEEDEDGHSCTQQYTSQSQGSARNSSKNKNPAKSTAQSSKEKTGKDTGSNCNEKFYDNVDEMRAFMSMFMELVGLFGNDLPPNLAQAYKGMGKGVGNMAASMANMAASMGVGGVGMPGVTFSWSSENNGMGDLGSDGGSEDYDSEDDGSEDDEDDDDDDDGGSDDDMEPSGCEMHNGSGTPAWEPMVRHYFHMNLKEQVEHERQLRDAGGQCRTMPKTKRPLGSSMCPNAMGLGAGTHIHRPSTADPHQIHMHWSQTPYPVEDEEMKKKKNQKKKANKKKRQKERKQKEAEIKAHEEIERKLQREKEKEDEEKRRLAEIQRQRLVRDAVRVAMFKAVQEGNLDLLMKLVDEEHAKLDDQELDSGNTGRSLLHACVTYRKNQEAEEVRNKRFQIVRYLLSCRKPRLDCGSVDHAGCTVLHRAAEGEDCKVAEALLQERQKDKQRKQEIDVNARCKEKGWTPLHYAAIEGSKEIVNMLLEAGALVNTTAAPSAGKDKGHTPLGAVKKALSNGGNKMDTQRKRKLEQVSKILAKAVSAVEEMRQQKEEKERLEKLSKLRSEEAKRNERLQQEMEQNERKQAAIKAKQEQEARLEQEKQERILAQRLKEEEELNAKAAEDAKKKKKRNRKKKGGEGENGEKCLDENDEPAPTALIEDNIPNSKHPQALQTSTAGQALKTESPATTTPAAAEPIPRDLNAVSSRDDLIAQLMLMGFTEEACHRATQSVGFDIDALITWLCEYGSEGATSQKTPDDSSPVPSVGSSVEVENKSASASTNVAAKQPTDNMTTEQRAKEAARRKEEARRINREWNATLPRRQKQEEEERRARERQAALERAQKEKEEKELAEKTAAASAQVLMNGPSQPLLYSSLQQQIQMLPGLQSPALERASSLGRIGSHPKLINPGILPSPGGSLSLEGPISTLRRSSGPPSNVLQAVCSDRAPSGGGSNSSGSPQLHPNAPGGSIPRELQAAGGLHLSHPGRGSPSGLGSPRHRPLGVQGSHPSNFVPPPPGFHPNQQHPHQHPHPSANMSQIVHGHGGPPGVMHPLMPPPGPGPHRIPHGVPPNFPPPPMMGPGAQMGPSHGPHTLSAHSGPHPIQHPHQRPQHPPMPPPMGIHPPQQPPGISEWPQSRQMSPPFMQGGLHDWSNMYQNLPPGPQPHWNSMEQGISILGPQITQSQSIDGAPVGLSENEMADLDAANNGELSAGAPPFIPRFPALDSQSSEGSSGLVSPSEPMPKLELASNSIKGPAPIEPPHSPVTEPIGPRTSGPLHWTLGNASQNTSDVFSDLELDAFNFSNLLAEETQQRNGNLSAFGSSSFHDSIDQPCLFQDLQIDGVSSPRDFQSAVGSMPPQDVFMNAMNIFNEEGLGFTGLDNPIDFNSGPSMLLGPPIGLGFEGQSLLSSILTEPTMPVGPAPERIPFDFSEAVSSVRLASYTQNESDLNLQRK